jgi:hypothetical protein
LADSIKELSQDAHRTIDAKMRFGVGARQVAEEIEPVFRGALSYLGINDCEFSLRRLISCIHSELWPQAKAPYRPSGSVQNPNLEWLVGELHAWFYRYRKEKLSIRKSRDGTLRGSLPRVLSILQPWLSGTVPHNLSYSTLRRMLIRAKKQPSGDNSV